MSDMHAHSVAFVRETMLPEQEPPASEVGVVHWMRENLFRGWANTLMTVIAIFVIYKIVAGAFPWFVNGIWSTNSLAECREILQGTTGGCFSVLTERWNQLLFGFKYPQDQYWRLILAFVLLGLAAAPVLFNKLPKQMLFFTGLYPFIGFWLIWGGTLLAPLVALAGFLVGFAAFKKVEHQSFAMGALAFLVAALVTWFLGGFAIRSAPGFLALEAVPSRDMGGFMLNMILGVVCVSLSLPFGILLALGRQSDMPIIKWICVVFIEFIRGVPLITLLFVANVVLSCWPISCRRAPPST